MDASQVLDNLITSLTSGIISGDKLFPLVTHDVCPTRTPNHQTARQLTDWHSIIDLPSCFVGVDTILYLLSCGS